MFLKSGNTTIEKSPGNLWIPLSYNNAESHVRRIGNSIEVVVAEVMQCSSHDLLSRNALDVTIDSLIGHGVEILLLHSLIKLQSLIVLALALKNLTSLDEEGG